MPTKVQIDIHQFGHNFIVIVEDDSDPTPYRWAIVPTNKISLEQLETENYLAFVYCQESGQAYTRAEMTRQIAEAL